MIDEQSSALAAQHGLWSPALSGLRASSGITASRKSGVPPVMSGTCPARTPDTPRETHALPIHSPDAQKSALTCLDRLQKNFDNYFENAVTFNASQMPFNPPILVQFASHTISPLKPYGLALCAIFADGSAFHRKVKSPTVSRCPSTARNVKQGKWHEKNLEFFSGHFYGKSLGNPAKTIKKMLSKCRKNTRFLPKKNAKNDHDFQMMTFPVFILQGDAYFIGMLQRGDHSLDRPAADPKHWLLNEEMIYLSHGAFGACPRHVLAVQNEWRERLERQPMEFLVRELESHLDTARGALAQFVGADATDVVFVSNATTGVNTVLRSLLFQPGDELLATDHAYNACRNAVDVAAERAGARVVVARIPFPFRTANEIIAPVLERVTGRTRLAFVDHVTSQTGVVMPIERLVNELKQRGVDTLVDGAHAPGMVEVNLKKLGAAYYTGNCHKWLCSPRGAAFLHVARDRQQFIRPLTISHGANSARKDRSRFLIEFGWQGTCDPSACLSVPEAIRFIGGLLPGGWPEVMARNRALALAGRAILCAALGIGEPCPEEFIGSLAAVPLPDAAPEALPRLPLNEYPLQDALRIRHGIEVPVISWPAPPRRVLRVSAQLYNSLPQYERLAAAIKNELPG